ncbi:hypothetical protein Scep_021378 [Stephania cephalantha]|uniref:Uncharacterized protein n=1 Tax=Stephania cephalantha TaxID=152367 RepID=A0AAP0I1U4_9MAGN
MGLRHVVTRCSTANGRLPPEPAANTQQPPDLPRCTHLSYCKQFLWESEGEKQPLESLKVVVFALCSSIKSLKNECGIYILSRRGGKSHNFIKQLEATAICDWKGSVSLDHLWQLDLGVCSRGRSKIVNRVRCVGLASKETPAYVAKIIGWNCSVGAWARVDNPLILDEDMHIADECKITDYALSGLVPHGDIRILRPSTLVDSHSPIRATYTSFGVVFVESLTSRKAIEEGGHDNDHNEWWPLLKRRMRRTVLWRSLIRVEEATSRVSLADNDGFDQPPFDLPPDTYDTQLKNKKQPRIRRS